MKKFIWKKLSCQKSSWISKNNNVLYRYVVKMIYDDIKAERSIAENLFSIRFGNLLYDKDDIS